MAIRGGDSSKIPLRIGGAARALAGGLSVPVGGDDQAGAGLFTGRQGRQGIQPAVFGPEVVNGMRLEVGGTGAWKTFTVLREDTGEVIVDRKFYKAEFDKLLDDPELSEFLSDLLDAAMTKKRDTESPDVDAESYEEVRSIAMGLDEGTLSISPED